jgi:hypothetical protein
MRFFFMGPRILGIRPGISFSVSNCCGSPPSQSKTSPPSPMTGGFVWTLTLMCITVITQIAPAATFSQAKQSQQRHLDCPGERAISGFAAEAETAPF